MNWTTNKPTEPGLYLWRYGSNKSISHHLVKISVCNGGRIYASLFPYGLNEVCEIPMDDPQIEWLKIPE